MKRTTKLSIADRHDDREMRDRMAQVRVLLADRNITTATQIQKILFSLGIRHIDMATDGEHALEFLKSKPYDFLITEWNMMPFDGITLVKTIRAARKDKRIRRDIPIIMLTAKADMDSIQIARDAGINEFVVKPFSAKTISSRIIQIIDNPRSFVIAPDYAGPCRRRKVDLPPGVKNRREPKVSKAIISPPDYRLLEKLGGETAREIITEAAVQQADKALQRTEGEFVEWAMKEIEELQRTYAALKAAPDNVGTQLALKEAAYAIQSQAGMFGFTLGTEIGGMLVHYLTGHPFPNANHMIVIGKHIDTIRVVFSLKDRKSGNIQGREVVGSLKKLISKLE